MPEKITPSPITTFGAKFYMIQYYDLHRYIPPMTDSKNVYVELFAGSAVLFFNVQCGSAILNDLDDKIFNFWNVILNKPTYDLFVDELQKAWVGEAWYTKYIAQPDPISQAIAFYIQNRNAYGGINDDRTTWYNRTKPKPFVKDFTKWKQKMDQCHLTVWHLDFREALTILNRQQELDREKYIIFEDPPYVSDNLQSYRHNFTPQDHEDLAKLNHASTHHILITYERNPLIERLYRDWYIQEMPSRYFVNTGNPHGTELLISNHPIRQYSMVGKQYHTKALGDFLGKK